MLVVQFFNFAALAFGKEMLAKVTYVTVLGPIILLVILLFQALQLDGASDGIAFYIGRFDTALLMDPRLWAAACSQILFSLSPGFGTAISMSSTTAPKTDVFKTCISVVLANSTFSLTGGFAIFSILGNLAKRQGKSVAVLAKSSSTGLAFITIADGMQTFGAARNVMSVLFFVMLITLGLDSSFAWIETVVIVCTDYLRERNVVVNRTAFTGGLIAVLYLLGLVYCTRAGNNCLDAIDHFLGSRFLLVSCFVESVALTLGYGFPRIERGMSRVSPDNMKIFLPKVWEFVCTYTVPVGPALLFLYGFYKDIEEPYEGYPMWLQTIGWSSLAVCLGMTVATLPRKGESALQEFSSITDTSEDSGSQSDE